MNKSLSVILNTPETAIEAAEWCKHHTIKYDLEYWGWPGSTKYKFIFVEQEDLMLFSLKWT